MSEPVTTVQQVTIAAPGSQVIALLLAGLLLAFSFQIMVANIQVIGGLVALRIRYTMTLNSTETAAANPSEESPTGTPDSPAASEPTSSRPAEDSEEAIQADDNEPKTGTDHSNTIGLIAGLGLMVGIILAIAPASFLAVKLSRVDQPLLGAISGLVLWAAYFLILTWLSSRTLGSIVQTVLGGALEGLGQILGAISRLFQRQPGTGENPATEEIQQALSNYDLDASVQTYLSDLPPIQFDLKPVEEMLTSMLASPALQSIAGRQLLQAVDVEQLGDLLRRHTPLSEAEIAQILKQLAALWSRVRSQEPQKNAAGELIQLLRNLTNEDSRATSPAERSQEIEDKETGIAVTIAEQKTSRIELDEGSGNSNGVAPMESKLNDWSDLGIGTDRSTILSSLLDLVAPEAVLEELLNQVDLSEWEVAQLWQQFQHWQQRLTGKSVEPLAIVPEDVEQYLLSAEEWELQPDAIAEDIPDLFYDPEADPPELQRQLDLLNFDQFSQILNQRGDLTSERVTLLATQLETLRQQAVDQARQAQATAALSQIEIAFHNQIAETSVEASSPESLVTCWEQALASVPPETVVMLKPQLDSQRLCHWLEAYTQLSPGDLPTLVSALETSVRVRVETIASQHAEIQAAIETIQTKLTAYLTYTGLDKLTDASIRQKIQTLVDDTAVNVGDLQQALPRLETDFLQAALSHRHGLEADHQAHLVAVLQATWQEQVPAAQAAGADPQSLGQKFADAVASMVSRQQVEQLSLEDLKPQLRQLIRDPNLALNTLAQDLSHIDWSPLLSVVKDIRFDASQGQELLTWLREQLYAAARLPRRWITRRQDQGQRFSKRIQRYLKHHARESLNPDKMRRDLQKMLQVEVKRGERSRSAQRRVQSRAEALASLPQLPDLEEIATALSDREDMTPDQANRVAQSLQTIWQEITEQFQASQQEAEAALAALLEKFTTALQSLPLPADLLDRIEQEIGALLSPFKQSLNHISGSLSLWRPDSPLAMLRGRLNAWNQTNIAKLIETRDDLSGTVNRYIQTQLDTVRSEIDQELAALEQSALKQLNDIRRVAATAAIWLLGIALVSAASSALAGFLAVRF